MPFNSPKKRYPWVGKPPAMKDRHKKILSLIGKRWAPLGLAMICMAAMAAATSATAYLVKPVLDDIFLAGDRTMVQLVPFALLGIYLVRGLAYFGQEYLMFRVGRSVLMDLRNMLFGRILDFPVSFFHKEKTGGLISRVQYDVGLVKSMSAAATTGVLRDSFTILGLVGILFYMDWIMASFAMVVLPLGFYVIYLFGGKVRRVATICQVAMADLHSFLHETFVGAKIVKAFGAEKQENEIFSKKTTGLFEVEMKSIRAQSLSSPVVQAFAGAGIAFIVWYGGNKVLSGESTPGAFFSFIAALVMLYDPVRKLSRLNNSIQQGLAALDRVFDAYEQKFEIRESEDVPEIGDGPFRVVFDGVWFRYEGEAPVLKNIDLAVDPGEVVALAGSSGAGKTSLVNLVPRFYDVWKGSVRVGAKDVRKVRLSSLRSKISVVTQESVLFNDTIRNNIAYGAPGCSMEQIQAAAEASYAHDFIRNLPDGYDTMVGELGGRLSGGEKQRICIARALLKNAPVLILDEATSALDSEAEVVVQKALKNLMKNKTTLVVAHRFSTIRSADRVAVLSDGEIKELGTHEELMKQKGHYFKLFGTQIQRKPQAESFDENGKRACGGCL